MKIDGADKLIPYLIAGGLGLFFGCGDGGGSESSCQAGTRLCPCLAGMCQVGLVCVDNYCLGEGLDETGGDGDGDIGDGDGDGAPGDGDGDGDGMPGDGDGDGTPGDGDGDGTPGDGDGDGDGTCEEDQYPVLYAAPKLMLVVDASGSMTSNTWDHDLNPNTPSVTRWYSLHSVVSAIGNNFDQIIDIGIQRFPSEAACDPNPCYNSTACIVANMPEAGVAPNNGAAIIAAIPGANDNGTQIEGATPATLGINSALNHLLGLPGDEPRHIVLITDGAANCTPNLPFPDVIESYDETLAPTIDDAYVNDGIPTFVVGIDIINQLIGQGPDGSPEANPYQRLNEVALAGGVPKDGGMGAEKFYNATDQNELLVALEQIFDSVIDCTIDLSELPGGLPSAQQVDYVSIEAGGQALPYLDSCGNQSGWTWVQDGQIAGLCGLSCDNFATGAADFDVVYGCP